MKVMRPARLWFALGAPITDPQGFVECDELATFVTAASAERLLPKAHAADLQGSVH
jgi:hypothetical protein